jgi:hypothetical protein
MELRLICGISDTSSYGPFLLYDQWEDGLMADKPTYEELEQRVREFEQAEAEGKKVEKALRKREHDLGERVKELNCLYRISALVDKYGTSLDKILRGTIDLIPVAWQYAEIASARIILNDQEYKTKNFKETEWKVASNIIVYGETAASIEVCYLEERPQDYEGPFLKEERSLIDSIAERLGHIVERIRAEEKLGKAHSKLDAHSRHLEEVNIALKVLLEQRQNDKTDLEEKVLSNVKQLVSPHLERLKKSRLDPDLLSILPRWKSA